MTGQIGPEGFVFDPETGEVIADEGQVKAMAAEYVAVVAAREEAQEQVRRYGEREAELDLALRSLTRPQQRLEVEPGVVLVRKPAARPAQRVSRPGCEPYAEQLLDLNLGRMEYRPPGIAEVRRRSGEIIAAGVPLDEIAPEPPAGPDTFAVIRKGEK